MNANLASIRNIRDYYLIRKVIYHATHANGETWIGGSDGQVYSTISSDSYKVNCTDNNNNNFSTYLYLEDVACFKVCHPFLFSRSVTGFGLMELASVIHAYNTQPDNFLGNQNSMTMNKSPKEFLKA